MTPSILIGIAVSAIIAVVIIAAAILSKISFRPKH